MGNVEIKNCCDCKFSDTARRKDLFKIRCTYFHKFVDEKQAEQCDYYSNALMDKLIAAIDEQERKEVLK